MNNTCHRYIPYLRLLPDVSATLDADFAVLVPGWSGSTRRPNAPTVRDNSPVITPPPQPTATRALPRQISSYRYFNKQPFEAGHTFRVFGQACKQRSSNYSPFRKATNQCRFPVILQLLIQRQITSRSEPFPELPTASSAQTTHHALTMLDEPSIFYGRSALKHTSH